MIDQRFILFKKLARGGMAEIYLGKTVGEDGFERVCCFKRILPHFSQEKEFIAMFRDEAHIGKRLQHANIVRVEGFEEVEGSFAIVMEFINGADLHTVLATCAQEQTRLSIPMVIYIIAEAARGLHFAHTKLDEISKKPLGIVHRDISPQNILISFEGEVKVTDFGIADAESKLTDTKTGIVKGRFSYMSPEQVRGLNVDARSDVFSLSILFWELLTMRRLFQADSDALTIHLVRDCLIPEDISAFNSEVDEELSRILFKGLSREAQDRYESAGIFERELRQYQARRYPNFSVENLSTFLKDLLQERRLKIENDIKELLTQKIEKSSSAPVQEETQIVRTNTQVTRSDNVQNTRSNNLYEPARPRQATGIRNVIRYEPPAKSNGFSIALVVFLLLAMGGLGIWYMQQKRNPASWSIQTSPNTVKLELDGVPLEEGRYIKTPLVLNKISPGSHVLKISRSGYSDEVISRVLRSAKELTDKIVLKQVDRMAPLQIRLKFAVPELNVTMDDGLVDEKLTFSQALNLREITFGKEHVLSVSLADRSSFQCAFTPRSQNWAAPFLVVVEPDLRKCSYPLY